MIDSGLFSRSTIFNMEDMSMPLPQQLPSQSQIKVQKSSLYHLIHSFIKSLSNDVSISKQQKNQSCFEYGFEIGMNFVEQQSFGYVKYFVTKNDKNDKSIKHFIAEMKLLNARIWTAVFGSTSKLFSITTDTTGKSYKLDDNDFYLTRYLVANNDKAKDYIKLVHQFTKGIVWGFMDKMNLNAQINFIQLTDNKISLEIKNISKKTKLQNF